ncbi:MAG: ion channel [Candidatus Peregrinibacteria bacterium]|nr:ion channel [Candidatus Peregrinibacteria bacterium]
MSANKKQRKEDLILMIAAVVLVLVLGATIYHLLEGWTYLDSVYFITMTATTVGYGDFTPSTPLTKLITIIYSISIVPFILYAFSYVAKSQIANVYDKIHHLETKQKDQEAELDSTERKLQQQKKLIKEQENELDLQQQRIKTQLKKMREQEKELEEHDKAIEDQKRKMREQTRINKEQESEITEHDKELEVVEEIMEKELKK